MHNKKTNSMLVYEFLAHEVVRRLLENRDTREVFSFVEKYFKGTVLSEELDLFKALLSVRDESDDTIQKVINEVRHYAQKIDHKKLIDLKNKAIKEINEKFGSEIFEYRTKNYRLYASIQVFLNSVEKKNQKINESVDNIKVQSELVKNLKENLTNCSSSSSSRYGDFVFITAIDKVSEEIKKLKGMQKEVMLNYLDTISEKKSSSDFFKRIYENNKNIFDSYKSDNADTNKKMSVAKKKLSENIDNELISEDSKLKTLLDYCELFDAIKE